MQSWIKYAPHRHRSIERFPAGCALKMADPIPFQLQLKGPEFDYKFSNPSETIKLQLTDSGSVLTDQKVTGQQILSGSRLSEPVRGTDITYEDLSLRFIYWKNARYEGEQRVRTITCSIVLVQPSARNTEYGSVRLWIAKDRGALIKAEGYNWQGKPIKRFEVISATADRRKDDLQTDPD